MLKTTQEQKNTCITLKPTSSPSHNPAQSNLLAINYIFRYITHGHIWGTEW